MKILYKEINNCEECPFYKVDTNSGYPYCSGIKNYEILPTVEGKVKEIPSWCVLDSVEIFESIILSKFYGKGYC